MTKNQKRDILEVTKTNSGDREIGKINPFRYRGYYYDAETGLYYLKTRYYDPEVGRFISQDDVSYLDPEHINGLNLYAYCGNNPVMFTDSTGTNKVKDFFSKVGRFLAGVTLTIVGGGISLVSFVPALANFPKSTSLLATGTLEGGLTVGIYGALLIGSVFDKQIEADLTTINWNPFNNNESAVMNCKIVSFYKGVPVFLISGMEGSMSLGAIWFDKSQGIEVLKHERGHFTQFFMMGLGNYLVQIGVPSAWKNGDQTPWELSASMFGGSALAKGFSKKQKRLSILYSALSSIPIINISTIIWYLRY